MMAADAATGMNFEEENFVPVRWTDWLALDIRDGDDCIGTPSRKVRVPKGYHSGQVQQGSAEASTADDETFERARRRALRLY
jgi:hypothetical protein